MGLDCFQFEYGERRLEADLRALSASLLAMQYYLSNKSINSVLSDLLKLKIYRRISFVVAIKDKAMD